ncbi:MAG: acetate/propionate family kinase [Burkholderiaceae bacterium]|nr:acetate/propionate family kinase [Burkholderiaceae bacterium]
MSAAIVVINAGSSSLKFSLYAASDGALALEQHGQVEGLSTAPAFIARGADGAVITQRRWDDGARLSHDQAAQWLADHLRAALDGREIAGIGHRVVHGGLAFAQPVRVDREVLSQLEQYVPLAPLHQPHNLAPIRWLLDNAPQVPQVACFDTAFHRTNSDLAQMFGLPHRLFERGVRRYGFHGLSYEYIASVLPQHDARAAAGRTLVLHLGNGASICALRAGRSVATSLGFTALDGLLMGTRCGALDPGVVLLLLDRGMSVRDVERLLYSESGLLGVSGISSDMRALLASDQPGAQRAIDLYCHRIQREIGSLAAVLGGLDAIVFTAGIGENAASIRARVLADAAWLGVRIDAAANERGAALISTADSAVRALALPTNEELMIARHTLALIA